ncbi:preprotein translocase subunit SecE [Desulfovibrio sulfodismutans]|uniref:Protein translocase subunit SecE n=1 Tax=Desulfolutivibrio sulfodismutans TaxID=63561 RepID=A0A7K3NKT7_9BACT|nr:preprotein translocase subunit SecE [Desulfolutivibrio sulfodismutans]NDY56792.1 preprotein translocase subunit SecE [Desulfolutivibrio sulfodismutans]QLA10932.1 preprotein translocase subunit SecE [Desulfolutivibrio sulfodismutans DSM 3696]
MVTKKTETDETAHKPAPAKADQAKGGKASAKAKPAGAKGEQGATGSPLKGKIEQSREFFEQAKAELKKVTWPTRKETVSTGIAVLILVLVMSIFLGLVDLGLARLVEFILA